MPENGMPGPVCDLSSVKESVCIHTKKILDGCRDKDCVEDLRFYPTQAAQEVLSGTQIIKGGCAELLYVYTDVEPITFNRGFYSIDMRYFYRVTLQVATGTPRSTEVEGLCVFDKRCILFGSEGSAKSFSSDTTPESIVPQTGLPTAVVEAVDPIDAAVAVSRNRGIKQVHETIPDPRPAPSRSCSSPRRGCRFRTPRAARTRRGRAHLPARRLCQRARCGAWSAGNPHAGHA